MAWVPTSAAASDFPKRSSSLEGPIGFSAHLMNSNSSLRHSKRWDTNPLDPLPECMKVVFEARLEYYNEIELLAAEEGKSCLVEYVKRAVGFCWLQYYSSDHLEYVDIFEVQHGETTCNIDGRIQLSGQINVRTSSSDQLQIALVAILSILKAVYKNFWCGAEYLSCSKNQKSKPSKVSNSSTNVKDYDNYNSVHSQTSSVPNNIEDDFDPRGTSTTKASAGSSNQVDLFGQDLIGGLIDALTSIPPENPATNNVSEVNLFADATFVTAAPHENKEATSQPLVRIYQL
ncbi:Clathrin interactor EPSIN 1 [Senna tora]|uniref:Clathrin interactor EPSIN 1 n=1 Tax=Senna tora TaxID=362788 RepID=A0A834TIE1_9FABA|nr:Clathrin interactor EPSIN 1 [Senna tora]